MWLATKYTCPFFHIMLLCILITAYQIFLIFFSNIFQGQSWMKTTPSSQNCFILFFILGHGELCILIHDLPFNIVIFLTKKYCKAKTVENKIFYIACFLSNYCIWCMWGVVYVKLNCRTTKPKCYEQVTIQMRGMQLQN